MMIHQDKFEDPHGPVRSLSLCSRNRNWHQAGGRKHRETRIMLVTLGSADDDAVDERHKAFEEAVSGQIPGVQNQIDNQTDYK